MCKGNLRIPGLYTFFPCNPRPLTEGPMPDPPGFYLFVLGFHCLYPDCLCLHSRTMSRLFTHCLVRTLAHLVYSLPSPGRRSSDLLSLDLLCQVYMYLVSDSGLYILTLDLLCQRDPSAGHLAESPLQQTNLGYSPGPLAYLSQTSPAHSNHDATRTQPASAYSAPATSTH